MTTNSAPTPYVTSAGSVYSGYSAFYAFDGAFGENNRWLTGGGASWLKLDRGIGNAKLIGSYAIKGQPSGRTEQSPTGWTLQGSNDDSVWDTLDTVTGESAWSAGELRTYTCDAVATAYRYFKLNITAPNSYVGVAELYLYEPPAATTYTFSGPTGVVNGNTSTNFSVTPDGLFTGTITPSDGGNGGTFNPASLTWSSSASTQTLTYTPASSGAKIISTTNNGGISNPASLNFYSATTYTIQPADLWDNGYSTNETDYYLSSPFARLVVTTNATGLNFTVWSTLYSSSAGNAKVAVVVDGTVTVYSCTTVGANTFNIDGLSAGTKTIQIVAGTGMFGSPMLGTFLKSVAWYGITATITSPSSSRQMVLYGDSIMTGWNTANPPKDTVGLLVRAHLNGELRHESWASRSLRGDSTVGPPAVAQTVIDQLTLGSPTRIWLAMGVNDYGHSFWSAADFGTAYGNLLDRLHSTLPNARIFAQTPITQGTETANSFGSTLGDYRSQITTLAGARSWVTLVDGSSILTYSADYIDDQHPSTAGDVKYAAAITPYAVVPTGPTATAVSSSEIDLTWVDNSSDETSYTVQYTTDPAWGSYSSVTGIAANSQSYAKTGLSASTPYYFRVVTVEVSGNSTPSTVVTATTASADITITATTIAGVAAPVTGATPVATVTSGTGYTGTVSWSPTVASIFLSNTAYTATITLSPTSGYTLTGVTLNQFTIAGSTGATNSANSGTITGALFPATAATNISSAGVTGFTAPATGGTPQVFGNLTAGSAQYTVTGLTWSPTDNPFHAATAYTATVVLTSAATYKFPTGGIASPTADVGTVNSIGTTSGGDVSGNHLTFTVLFSSTAAKITPTLSVTNSSVIYNASQQVAAVSGSVAGTASNVQYAGSLTVPTNAGAYAITADFSPTDSADYNSLTGASAGNFVINTASQSTLTFTGQTVTSPSAFSALSTTGGSGTGSVIYAATTAGTAGCSIIGAALSYTTAGTCGVTATKAADSNYNSASSSEATFTINAATPTPTVAIRGGSNSYLLILKPTPAPTKPAQKDMTPQQRASLIVQIKQQLISLITQLIQMLTLQVSQVVR